MAIHRWRNFTLDTVTHKGSAPIDRVFFDQNRNVKHLIISLPGRSEHEGVARCAARGSAKKFLPSIGPHTSPSWRREQSAMQVSSKAIVDNEPPEA
jgi:hypothetical protein